MNPMASSTFFPDGKTPNCGSFFSFATDIVAILEHKQFECLGRVTELTGLQCYWFADFPPPPPSPYEDWVRVRQFPFRQSPEA
ncbi:hypothetical protein OUZ56_009264 [Daphnia magna]|uniref:Uncharacterized protein n=1 Tax=Daphnia magna TaxID=35525 RepID=A0ABR0AFG9_9CRUS|nr:hypothetical protein OUZ56_009264 [Daphnia magna]